MFPNHRPRAPLFSIFEYENPFYNLQGLLPCEA